MSSRVLPELASALYLGLQTSEQSACCLQSQRLLILWQGIVSLNPRALLYLLQASCAEHSHCLCIKAGRFTSALCRENSFEPFMELLIRLLTNHDHIPFALAWDQKAISRKITFLIMNDLFNGGVGFPCRLLVGVTGRLIIRSLLLCHRFPPLT